MLNWICGSAFFAAIFLLVSWPSHDLARRVSRLEMENMRRESEKETEQIWREHR